jgi:predicted Zn-dependent protease
VINVTLAALVACLLAGVWWQYRHSPHNRDVRAAIVRAQAFLRSGRPDLAFASVHEFKDDEPEAAAAMTVAATALIRMKEFRLARLALERAFRLSPDSWNIAMMLAQLNLDLGNGQRGVEVLEQAVRAWRHDARLWMTLAKACRDLGDFARAIEAYQEVLQQQPSDRTALVEFLETLVFSGQSDLSGSRMSDALRLFPDDPEVLGLAARCAFNANRLGDAIALADRALKSDPRNCHALVARARAHAAGARWKDALVDAERVVTLSHDDPEVLQLLGVIESHLGMNERAAATLARRVQVEKRASEMTELTEKIKDDPDNPQHPWKMGVLALESGQVVVARRCFEAALALAPDHEAAEQSLTALRRSHPEAFGLLDPTAVRNDAGASRAAGGVGRRKGR